MGTVRLHTGSENLSLTFYAAIRVIRSTFSSRQDAKHAKKILSSSNFAAFAPLRERQFFRSVFHQEFQISLARFWILRHGSGQVSDCRNKNSELGAKTFHSYVFSPLIVMKHCATPLTMKTLTPSLSLWEREGVRESS